MKVKVLLFMVLFVYANVYCQENVVDIQNNTYSAITIGNQIWFQQNLESTVLQDGTPIVQVQDSDKWGLTNEPAYCIILGIDTVPSIGFLYNWHAVNTGKLCPLGWHVPKDSEWTTLVTYIGGELSGGALRVIDTIYWKSPNLHATNSTGFSALPAGYRSKNGKFYNQLTHAFFWTTSIAINETAWYRSLGYKDVIIGSTPQSQQNGLSVRCVKD